MNEMSPRYMYVLMKEAVNVVKGMYCRRFDDLNATINISTNTCTCICLLCTVHVARYCRYSRLGATGYGRPLDTILQAGATRGQKRLAWQTSPPQVESGCLIGRAAPAVQPKMGKSA